MSYVDLTVKDGTVVATHTSDAKEIIELRKRIEELEATLKATEEQLTQMRDGLTEVEAENLRLRDAVYLMRLRAYELGVPDVGDIGDRALSGEVDNETQ